MTTPVNIENLDMLKEVIGDDLVEILNSFISISPSTLDKIQQAINDQDADALRLHAHTLKGSAGNIGASQLPAYSLVLEDKGRSGNLEGAQADFEVVQAENQRVLEFLNDYVSNF